MRLVLERLFRILPAAAHNTADRGYAVFFVKREFADGNLDAVHGKGLGNGHFSQVFMFERKSVVEFAFVIRIFNQMRRRIGFFQMHVLMIPNGIFADGCGSCRSLSA